MTKPRLTFEEHDQLGERLAAIRRELQAHSMKLSNAYPRTGRESEPAKMIEEARQLLTVALHRLEDRLYEEHPQLANTDVYSQGRE